MGDLGMVIFLMALSLFRFLPLDPLLVLGAVRHGRAFQGVRLEELVYSRYIF